MITQTMLGAFKDEKELRDEFMAALNTSSAPSSAAD
jgi:GTP cyclohydrolase I